MKTRNALLTLATIAAATALPFAASAQTFNPDNDSAAFFRYEPSAAPAARVTATAPKTGEQSRDGLYVYSGTDREMTVATLAGIRRQGECMEMHAGMTMMNGMQGDAVMGGAGAGMMGQKGMMASLGNPGMALKR